MADVEDGGRINAQRQTFNAKLSRTGDGSTTASGALALQFGTTHGAQRSDRRDTHVGRGIPPHNSETTGPADLPGGTVWPPQGGVESAASEGKGPHGVNSAKQSQIFEDVDVRVCTLTAVGYTAKLVRISRGFVLLRMALFWGFEVRREISNWQNPSP